MLPPDGASYPQILRGESYVWWRSVLGVVFGLSLFLLLTAVVSQAVIALSLGAHRRAGALPGVLRRGVRVRAAARHAGGQPRHRHADPDQLDADGGRAPDPAALAVVGAGRGSAGATCSAAWWSRWWRSTACCCCRPWSRRRPLSPAAGLLGLPGRDRADLTAAGDGRGGLLPRLSDAGARQPGRRSRGSASWSRRWCSPCCTARRTRRCSWTGWPSACWPAVLVWRTGGLEAGHRRPRRQQRLRVRPRRPDHLDRRARGHPEISWVDAAFDVGGFALFAVLAYLLFRLLRLRNRVGLAERSRFGAGPEACKVSPRARRETTRRGTVGYRVIGSPTDSGSVSLGSSPSTPATQLRFAR